MYFDSLVLIIFNFSSSLHLHSAYGISSPTKNTWTVSQLHLKFKGASKRADSRIKQSLISSTAEIQL